MSWRDAPLYVAALDLALWTYRRFGTQADAAPAASPTDLSRRILGSVTDLVEQVSIALTFPEARDRHLRSADETLVKLRTELRLAQGLGDLAVSSHEHACDRLAEIGRMIGGWRKRLERPAGSESARAPSEVAAG